MPGEFVRPLLSHEVQQPRVEIVKAFDGANGREGECDKGPGGEGILRRTFVKIRLVVMCQIIEERMRH